MRRMLSIAVCMLLLLAIPAAVASAPYGKEGVTRLPDILTGEGAGNDTVNMTVADVIAGNENLTTLAAAVEAANMTERLRTGGPYTVFAPTDDAFAALDNETLDHLLNDTGQLEAILMRHVSPGNHTSDKLESIIQGGGVTPMEIITGNMTGNESVGVILTTLHGSDVIVNQSDGTLTVEDANIIIADIPASNGVVHLIDAVLLPGNVTDNDSMVDVTPDNETYLPIVPPMVIDTPRMPSVIDTPRMPSVIDTPRMPSVIDTPRMPSVINTPRMPSVIDTPRMPSGIDTPSVRTPSVPVQPPGEDDEPISRPATGTIVSGIEPDDGCGVLIVDNSEGWDDAVAVLTHIRSNQTVFAVYVRQGDTATIRGISDGTYDLYFTTGENWDWETCEFTESADYYVFEDSFRYTTYTTEDDEYIYTHYTSSTVTLYTTYGGNTTPDTINKTAFPEL